MSIPWRLHIVRFLISFIPETRGFGLKRMLYRWSGIKIGSQVKICSSVKFLGHGELVIGDNTWIGHETLIVLSSKVFIGKNVDIAPRVFIGTGSHKVESAGLRVAGPGLSESISIGSGTWICACAVIIPGINIGQMALIAAGSVVISDVPKKTMFAGNPAVCKKKWDSE